MPSRYKGSTKELRALNAYITLMRAANSVSERLHRDLGRKNLTPGQFAVIEAVYHCGSLRLGALAEKLLVTCGNVTAILKNLEHRQLARRVRDDADRRVFHVELTRAGERLLEEVFPAHVERLVAEFRTLSPSEQEDLRRLCRTLGRASKEGRETA